MSVFKRIFGQSNKEVEAPLNTAEFDPEKVGEVSSPKRRSSKEVVGQDPYSEFVKGKQNSYMKDVGRNMYDNVSNPKQEPSVWEQIVKSDKVDHPDKVQE